MKSAVSVRLWIEKYPVILYCYLAFLITWGIKYLYAAFKERYGMPAFNFSLISSFGPSIAALLLIIISDGKDGLKRTLLSMINRRVGAGWIALSILFEPAVFTSILLLYIISYGMPQVDDSYSLTVAFSSLVITFFTGIFRWGLAEEIGWRGWMLPKLLEKMSPFRASLILAVVASAWHINPVSFPDYFTLKEGTHLIGYYPEIVERMIISVPITMVMTYLFIRTSGSLLPAILFHSASNTSYFWIKDIFGIVTTDFFRIMFLIFLAVILIIFSSLLNKQNFKNAPE